MLGNAQAFNKFLRCTIGLVFILSGLIKLNDPIGFSWILEAYFKVFAIDFTPLFLKLLPWCLTLAIGIALLELVWGIALLVSFQLRLTLLALLCLTTFFTWLTFYTAVFRRMGSCGCFGDLIILTPWQSFLKSIGLGIALYSLHKQLKQAEAHQCSQKQCSAIFIGGALGLAISGYAYWHVPLIDFSSFKKRANLLEISQNKSLTHHPYNNLAANGNPIAGVAYATHPAAQDGNRVSSKYPNTDFVIWNEQGEITNQLLQGNQLLIIVQSPRYVNPETYKLLENAPRALAADRADMHLTCLIPFHAMRSSLPSQLDTAVAWASPELLRALLKRQAGFIWLKDGIIIEKGSMRTLKQLTSE